ncbi:MAG: MarR family transcriptional regulator [Anaerolineae bacterium]|nr:MarR family transcriptional regulator [Anaerolineae bacterium]
MCIPFSREERVRAIKDAFHYLTWVATRRLAQVLQPFGLTFPQFIVLDALAAHQRACAMRDLIQATFEDPPTMTGIIDRLVKMKLVHRTRSEKDRRVVLVEVTSSGIKLMEQINEEMIRDDLTSFADLTDDQLTTLEQLLRYKLRMLVGRFRSLQDDELDTEIEHLRKFANDPINYAKLEDQKSL